MTPFEQLLEASCVLIHWQPSDKWQAIRDLIGCLERSGKIQSDQVQAVTDAVFERERKMSTGLDSGVAIPHASTDAVPHMTAAIGISREGFDFEALDGEPTHIVVLLVYPPQEIQAHVRMLATIARLLHRPAVRKAMIEAETVEDVLDVLRQGETS